MSLSLYETTIPSYLQILGGVRGVLDKGAEQAAAGTLDLDELVKFRLRDDMLPFSFQVISVWHQSLNAIKGAKAGEFAPPPKMTDMDYAACQGLVNEAISELQALKPEDINSLTGKPVIFKMGGMEIPFTSEGFLLSFALPNFYFHSTTTYTMLRQHGVPLGKMDFLAQLRVAQS